MKRAIEMARSAEEVGEVPVGAILVDDGGTILAETWNRTITLSDPSAHAEILAIRHAGKHLGNYRLLNMTLYVTVEPCVMCMGAAVHARLKRVVFGVHDPKWGAAGSLFNFAEKGLFNHFLEVTSGVCESECRHLMVEFFRKKRKY
jgi:tRNA(adenine34) deaminase